MHGDGGTLFEEISFFTLSFHSLRLMFYFNEAIFSLSGYMNIYISHFHGNSTHSPQSMRVIKPDLTIFILMYKTNYSPKG